MIIDDVIANVGVDFEEYGMDEDVLTSLQAVRDVSKNRRIPDKIEMGI